MCYYSFKNIKRSHNTDKFAIKHSTSQAWFGYTREPNDIRYLRQILGEDVENLTSLQDGEFLYLTRNKLCKISIKPFQNNTPKRLISIPEFTPMPKMKLQKTENTKALVSLIVALMWLAAIILALSQLG